MMKMPVATATPTSGYSRCHDGTTFEAACGHAKERRDDLVRRANASALLPPLAHFACPSCPPSRDIVGAALCCRSGPQVWMWGELQGESTGGLGLLVLCCLRWLAGMWGHFFVCKSGRRWADRCGRARRRARRSSKLGRHYDMSWPALRKCMLPHLLPTISRVHLSISSDSRHSPLSLTCPPHTH